MERSSRVEPSPAALHWPETNHPDVDREAVRGKLGNLCSEDRRCPRINRRTVQISHPNRPSIDGSVLTGPVPARVWRKTETKDPSGGPVEESEGMIRPRHPLRGRLPKHVRRGGIPRGLSVQGSGGVGWGGSSHTAFRNLPVSSNYSCRINILYLFSFQLRLRVSIVIPPNWWE